jgi:hypothetical protein
MTLVKNTLNKVIVVIFRILYPKYGNYARIVVLNKVRRFFKPAIENKYLFILSPPYCGSTLLNEIISTSSFVSVNNPLGTREGQTLPTIKKIMFDDRTRWDKTIDFDWVFIKEEWRKYWDITKPILLEKSPANIIRVKSIFNAFSNSYFIIFYRNPYCHCESLIRRNKYSAKKAANFAVQSLHFQKENIRFLTKNTLKISYEELTDNPNFFVNEIMDLLPQLSDIKTDIEFSAHNFKGKSNKIENLNNEKIGKLSQLELDEINDIFLKQIDLLKYFKYEIILNVKPFASKLN